MVDEGCRTLPSERIKQHRALVEHYRNKAQRPELEPGFADLPLSERMRHRWAYNEAFESDDEIDDFYSCLPYRRPRPPNP